VNAVPLVPSRPDVAAAEEISERYRAALTSHYGA